MARRICSGRGPFLRPGEQCDDPGEDRGRRLGVQLLVHDGLGEGDERTGRRRNPELEGTAHVDGAGQDRVDGAQVVHGSDRVEPGRPVVIDVEQSLGRTDGCSLDGQDLELRRDAALGREAARLAAGGHHAMARDHDGERVASEGLADGLGRAGRAQLGRDLSVGAGVSGGDGAGHLVDALVEARHAVHVERDARQVGGPAGEQLHHRVDRSLHLLGGPPLVGLGPAAAHAGPRRRRTPFGQLHADEPPRAPGDPAVTDRRLEEGEALGSHRDVLRPRRCRTGCRRCRSGPPSCRPRRGSASPRWPPGPGRGPLRRRDRR